MLVQLQKFGTTLISRETGREAFAAFQPRLQELGKTETLEIDFQGVLTFSPSWADEFLTPLRKLYGERLVLRPSDNPSVKATLEILDQNPTTTT